MKNPLIKEGIFLRLFLFVDDLENVAHTGKECFRILKISAFKVVLAVDFFYRGRFVIHAEVEHAAESEDYQPQEFSAQNKKEQRDERADADRHIGWVDGGAGIFCQLQIFGKKQPDNAESEEL